MVYYRQDNNAIDELMKVGETNLKDLSIEEFKKEIEALKRDKVQLQNRCFIFTKGILCTTCGISECEEKNQYN